MVPQHFLFVVAVVIGVFYHWNEHIRIIRIVRVREQH